MSKEKPTRRRWLEIAGGIIVGLLLGAIAGYVVGIATVPPTQVVVKGKPFEGRTIRITTWSAEWHRAIEPAIKEFEEETGAHVEVEERWEGFIEAIEAAPADEPPFDVMQVEDMTYSIAKEKELILPIRWENVPNAEYIDPVLKEKAPMKEGYGVIKGGMPIIPIYNTEYVKFTPTTWKDMLRSEVKGKISISKYYFDEDLYDAAFALDLKPGAEELYTNLDDVFNKLKEFARWSLLAYETGTQVYELIAKGDVWMVHSYGGDAQELMWREPQIKCYLPEEGYLVYLDVWCVVRGTKNRDVAEALINKMVAKDAQLWCMELMGVSPSITDMPIPHWVKEAPNIVWSHEGWQNAVTKDVTWILENYDTLYERFEKEVLTEIGG